MNALNFRFVAFCILAAPVVGPALAQPVSQTQEELEKQAAAPTVDETSVQEEAEKPAEKHIEKPARPLLFADKPNPANARKLEKLELGNIPMRQPMLRLDQIILWRADAEKASDIGVWDGTAAADAPVILPALVASKNFRIKSITYRIAMSGVYSPAGLADMDYVRWRADILMAQKHPELAARLMNAARLGRDSREDAVRRTAYELAAGDTEAACLESMALGDAAMPFWQGMAVLCARHLGDGDAAKNLLAALSEGAVKEAASSGNLKTLVDALIKESGMLPVPKPIANNHDILIQLQKLVADIEDSEDKKQAAQKNKGQLLLLSMGAWVAEKRGPDTQGITEKAMALAGL